MQGPSCRKHVEIVWEIRAMTPSDLVDQEMSMLNSKCLGSSSTYQERRVCRHSRVIRVCIEVAIFDASYCTCPICCLEILLLCSGRSPSWADQFCGTKSPVAVSSSETPPVPRPEHVDYIQDHSPVVKLTHQMSLVQERKVIDLPQSCASASTTSSRQFSAPVLLGDAVGPID